MKRGIFTMLAVLTLWGGAGLNFAAAQSFGRMGQQSPFRAPQSFGLIRTQTDANRIALEQQGAMRLNPDGSLQVPLANQGSSMNAMGGLQTGHSVTFFDYNQYFPLVPPGSGTTTGGTTGFGTGVTSNPYGQGATNNLHFLFGANRVR